MKRLMLIAMAGMLMCGCGESVFNSDSKNVTTCQLCDIYNEKYADKVYFNDTLRSICTKNEYGCPKTLTTLYYLGNIVDTNSQNRFQYDCENGIVYDSTYIKLRSTGQWILGSVYKYSY